MEIIEQEKIKIAQEKVLLEAEKKRLEEWEKSLIEERKRLDNERKALDQELSAFIILKNAQKMQCIKQGNISEKKPKFTTKAKKAKINGNERRSPENNHRELNLSEERIDTAFNRRFLFKCILEGDTEMATEMITKGVTPNFIGATGKTALIVAIERKDVHLVNLLLLSPKIDINLCNIHNGATPLITVCKGVDPENDIPTLFIVKLLLRTSGVQIDCLDKHGISALSYAVKSGCMQLVRILLSAGADINAGITQDGQKLTPMSFAKSLNFTDIHNLLVKLATLQGENKRESVASLIVNNQYNPIKAISTPPPEDDSRSSSNDWSDWSTSLIL